LVADTLYKYVVPERIDVLVNKRIRFTQPCFLNDPFEFKPGFPVPAADGIVHFEAKAKARDVHFRELSRLYGVLCLTTKKDSIPMWTHYAAAHEGFVIGFDTKSEFIANAISGGELSPVTYQPERPSLTGKYPTLIFLTKSTEWVSEEEWRWVKCCRSPSEYDEVLPSSSGELLYLCRFQPSSVREIILGCRANSTLKKSIQALTLTSEYRHVSLSRMALDEHHYQLQIESL
jgi:hypothetical protein